MTWKDRPNRTEMVALVATVQVSNSLHMRAGYGYILTNNPNGILYVGVTSDLVRRIAQHREGIIRGFTKRYALKRLVHFEVHDDIRSAIQREKNMKHWPSTWNVRLILTTNPEWTDLFDSLF